MEPAREKTKTTFDKIRHVHEDGSEYWISSELAEVLKDDGLVQYMAGELCARQQEDAGTENRNVTPIERMKEDGTKEQDYALTRKACSMIVEELPLRAEVWDARQYITPKKRPVGKAWKNLRAAIIIFPVIYSILAILLLSHEIRKREDKNARNDQLRAEAASAGYTKIANDCRLKSREMTVDGTVYIVFMQGHAMRTEQPGYAFPADSTYKIDSELAEKRVYEIYGRELGELTEAIILVEPYCLVRAESDLSMFLYMILYLSAALFLGIIVESILIVAYRRTYQNSFAIDG